MGHFGCQFGGNLGQTRELFRGLKPFELIFANDNLSSCKQWDKKKVKKLGGVIWNDGCFSILDAQIGTKLYNCHGPCHEILILRGHPLKPLGKTVPNFPTPIFRWGKLGQSYFLEYLINQMSKITRSPILEKYRPEIPSLNTFHIPISFGL